MIKAIYLTGLVVAAAFTLLWLLIDDMRREIREVEEGYYREKLEGKDKAALIIAEIGTSLTVGLMWWLAIIIIIGVVVYGNQFTFDEASDALDEIPDILLNFSLINAEILNKSNLQAEKTAKTGKANIITIGGKEYDCGKIGRKKYKAFREVYERLTRPEKQTYTDTELDEMINTIVLVYDNQFTFEEANKSLEDVSEIIFNFGLINANILKKLKDEAAGAKKNLSSQV